MKRLLPALLIASLASAVSAEEIQSVMVWHDSDRAPVTDDYRFAPGTEIYVFDMAIQRQAEARMNSDLGKRGLTFGPDIGSNQARTKDALRRYMSTEDFEEVSRELKAFGYGMSAAMQYRIERVPSILLNERYLVIGVNSVDEAVSLFRQEVN